VHHGGGIDPDGIFDQTLSFEGPHPRIWLGVSVEDQAAADERIPLLLDTPAAVRWISAEPLLGPVDLSPAYLPCPNAEYVIMDPETGGYECCSSCDYTGISDEIGIDWVVVGGESGPKARPMHPEWARGLRDQCSAAGVPFLFKQWGEWLPSDAEDQPVYRGEHRHLGEHWHAFKIGKKLAGRLLDGALHDGYPAL
jgi:protein gp37